MKNQTLLLFLLLPLLLAASCGKEDDDSTPSDKLPPATMTGENTFGCLVNGEVWLPHTEAFWDSPLSVVHDTYWVGCDQLKIGARKDNPNVGSPNILQSFSINVWCPKLGDNDVQAVFWDNEGCGIYRLDSISPHILKITKLDTINFIAAGTFSFTVINQDCQDTLRITDGRFDADSHL